jgi:ABC-2 type transport system ATP-binding protein
MESKGNFETAAEIVNLTKYYGDLLAVDHLSMQIRKGEVFGFLGPNGAGKTTSIMMICGLMKPTEGEVFINGHKIVHSKKKKIQEKVGICPQNIILWPKLTCFEQLVFMGQMYDLPQALARERADMLLSRLGLQEKRNKLAHTLSGGMQRRLNVMMALIHDPEFVVFDEPEAGLDPQSRVMVRDFIISTARDKTVIFTTHNMDEAERISDRIAIIDRGKLLKLDTPGNLKKSIGEGDMLELSLLSEDDTAIERAINLLKNQKLSVSRTGKKLVIRARKLIEHVHAVYRILESENIQVTEMNMRENTLEDVFIHLTGRTLRE